MTDCRAIMLLLTNSRHWGDEYPSRVQSLTPARVPRSGEPTDTLPYRRNRGQRWRYVLAGEHDCRDPRVLPLPEPSILDPCLKPKKGMARVTIQHLPDSPKEKKVIYL